MTELGEGGRARHVREGRRGRSRGRGREEGRGGHGGSIQDRLDPLQIRGEHDMIKVAPSHPFLPLFLFLDNMDPCLGKIEPSHPLPSLDLHPQRLQPHLPRLDNRRFVINPGHLPPVRPGMAEEIYVVHAQHFRSTDVLPLVDRHGQRGRVQHVVEYPGNPHGLSPFRKRLLVVLAPDSFVVEPEQIHDMAGGKDGVDEAEIGGTEDDGD